MAPKCRESCPISGRRNKCRILSRLWLSCCFQSRNKDNSWHGSPNYCSNKSLHFLAWSLKDSIASFCCNHHRDSEIWSNTDNHTKNSMNLLQTARLCLQVSVVHWHFQQYHCSQDVESQASVAHWRHFQQYHCSQDYFKENFYK